MGTHKWSALKFYKQVQTIEIICIAINTWVEPYYLSNHHLIFVFNIIFLMFFFCRYFNKSAALFCFCPFVTYGGPNRL